MVHAYLANIIEHFGTKENSMPTIYTEVEVDVELDDFDTCDLIDELESRDVAVSLENKGLIRQMYEYQELGKDIQPLLNELYWNILGRVM